jgi:hypothetical protein
MQAGMFSPRLLIAMKLEACAFPLSILLRESDSSIEFSASGDKPSEP